MRSLLISIFAVSMGTLSSLWAGDFRAGEGVTVNDPVTSDLYAAGGTIVVNAPASGDLNAAGGTVSINGSVGQDLQVMGGNVDIRGAVKDDLRGFGGTITVLADVAGDVVVCGGNLNLQGPRVDGDLVAAGGNIVVQSNVKGKLLAAGGSVILDGGAGDVDIRAESVRINGRIAGNAKISARKIELGPKASFAGTITYWSDNEPAFPGNPVRDESLRFENRDFHHESMIPGFVAAGIFGFVMSLFAGALTIAGIHIFFRTFLRESAELLDRSPGVPLTKGALFLLISPMGILLLFISLVGIPIGLFWLSLFGFSFVFAKAVAASAGSMWILKKAGKGDQVFLAFATAFGLFLGMKIVGLVPVLGFFVGLFWMVLSSGLVVEKFAVLRRGP